MSTTTPTHTAPDTRAALLPRLTLALIHSLTLEILVGLGNTFWLSLPESGNGWSQATPMWLLMAHVILGIAIIVLSVWIAVLAWKTGNRSFKRASIMGIPSIVIAFGAGSAFMGQVDNDTISFVMALGACLAIIFYATGLAKAADA